MGAFGFFGQPREEREAAIDALEDEEARARAVAEGYKDEKCPDCGRLFRAHVHFVFCGKQQACPMVSKKDDPRSLLDRFKDGN